MSSSPAGPLPIRGVLRTSSRTGVIGGQSVDASWLLEHATDRAVTMFVVEQFALNATAGESSAVDELLTTLDQWQTELRMTVSPRFRDAAMVTISVDAPGAVQWLAIHRYGVLVDALFEAIRWDQDPDADWRPRGSEHAADWVWVAGVLGVPEGQVTHNAALWSLLERLAWDVRGLARAALHVAPDRSPAWAVGAGRYVFRPGHQALDPQIMSPRQALLYLGAGFSAIEAVAWETGARSDRPDNEALRVLAALRASGADGEPS